LVAQSLSDRQIGQRLGIRPATVSKHVANLLGKTMLRNRLALALWAIDRGPPAAPGLAVNAR
jgi:DNA-binding NarL/FixJ family response regulator